MIMPNEIVVDNFAGGGGASTGMEIGLDRHVDIAINHDPDAIEMHRMNHPETEHYCESVWDVDPVKACRGRPVGLAWFSPDCKHFSKAKGNKPVSREIRGLAWVAAKWLASVPVRVMMLENVEEFMKWGPVIEVEPGKWKPDPERISETFEAFIAILTGGLPDGHPAWEEIRETLGDDFPHYDKLKHGLRYQVDFRALRACDYGAGTTRKRFFMVARNDYEPIVWPEPTHGPDGSGLLPYVTAADIIDWNIPVRSIFGRKKPLVEKTMERIARGIKKFVIDAENPFIVDEKYSIPFITEHANGSTNRNMPADEPLRTICAQVKGGHYAVVSAHIAKHYTGVDGSDIKEPLHTVTAKDHNALVTSHMIKFRGTNIGSGTDEPIPTISAGGNHVGEVRAFLLKYYGESFAEGLDTPLGTVTTRDRFGLVVIKGEPYQIVDIGMRMLEPRELFNSHGFDKDYKISHDHTGKPISKAKQVERVGNSVCPPLPAALVTANIGQPIRRKVAA